MQWEVIERAFVGRVTLVLIGDPKQAIYAFRGGDVVTYLRARDRADALLTLDTNYRSDAPAGAAAAARPRRRGARPRRHRGAPGRGPARGPTGWPGRPRNDPFRLRVVSRDSFGISGTRTIPMDDLRPVHRGRPRGRRQGAARLRARPTTTAPRSAGPGPRRRRDRREPPRRPRLPRRARPRPACPPSTPATPTSSRRRRRPTGSACSRRSSSRAAPAWCGRRPPTMFFGRTAAELADRPATSPTTWPRRCGAGPTTRGRAGSPRCSRRRTSPGWPSGCSAWRGGERHLTDVEHLTQLLHEVAHRDGLGLPALLQWLRNQREERAGAAERNRRLDSDARRGPDHDRLGEQGAPVPPRLPAVRLQPERPDGRGGALPRARRHPLPRHRRLGRAGLRSRSTAKGRAEMAGDDIRLTYVALTRAQSQVVAWWAPSWDEVNGGLSRLLRGRVLGQAAVPDSLPRQGRRRRGAATTCASGRPRAGRTSSGPSRPPTSPEPPLPAPPSGPRRPPLRPRRSTSTGAVRPTPR